MFVEDIGTILVCSGFKARWSWTKARPKSGSRNTGDYRFLVLLVLICLFCCSALAQLTEDFVSVATFFAKLIILEQVCY